MLMGNWTPNETGISEDEEAIRPNSVTARCGQKTRGCVRIVVLSLHKGIYNGLLAIR